MFFAKTNLRILCKDTKYNTKSTIEIQQFIEYNNRKDLWQPPQIKKKKTTEREVQR